MTSSTAGCSRTSGAKASSTTQPNRACGRCAPRLGHRRHVVDHIAERGGLDEQDFGHDGSAGVARYAPSGMTLIAITAIRRRITASFTGRRLSLPDSRSSAHDGSGHRRRRLYRQPHGARAGRRRRAASSCSTISRPASAGRRRRRCRSSSARPATSDLVATASSRDHASTPSSISPPRSWCRTRCAIRSAITATTRVNTRTLIECAVDGGVRAFHLLLDRRGLRQSRARAGRARTHRPLPISPYGTSKLMSEIMLHDAARGARPALRRAALFQRRRRRPARAAPANRRRRRRISSRSRSRPRSARAPRSTSSAPTIRRRTAPASATTSMSAISCARIRRRSRYLRTRRRQRDLQLRLRPRLLGARSDRRGASASAGVDFPVEHRRPPRPAIRPRSSPTSSASARRSTGGRSSTTSTPSSRHALAWERHLAAKRARRRRLTAWRQSRISPRRTFCSLKNPPKRARKRGLRQRRRRVRA